ncbi:MAG: hypothetical protein K5876_00995 [Ruminiclostridium sp.]|nr:hypothetical protein [Ruminiclostridium sp.]
MNEREDRLMRALGDIGDDLIGRAAPSYPEADGKEAANVTRREWRRYAVTRALGIAAAAVLIVGAAVLLWQNRDKIGVGETAGQSSVTESAGAMTDAVTDSVPMFETNSDRLKRLYPELFGLEPGVMKLSLGFKEDDNGEWVYTLYSLGEAWLSSMPPFDLRTAQYISAADMSAVLSNYDMADIGYIVRYDPATGEVTDATAEEINKVFEQLGIEERPSLAADETEPPEPEVVEHTEYKTIPIQSKEYFDRLPAAGEGDVFSFNMVVVCGSDLYQYVNYGAIPYGRVSELLPQYSLKPVETRELWNIMKPVCEDGRFIPEKAELTFRKITVYDYFTDEERSLPAYYDVTYYRLTDDYIISVGIDEWGTGIRLLRRLDIEDDTPYSEKMYAIRGIFELLWKAAEKEPDKYGNMSIVFVHDVVDKPYGDFGYYVEAIVETDEASDELYEYLVTAGADVNMFMVSTTAREQESYIPTDWYENTADRGLVKTEPNTGYGNQYIAVGNRVFKGAVHYSDSLDSLLSMLSEESEEIKKTLAEKSLDELRVTPYADVFDPILLPYTTDSVFYDLGENIVEVDGEGRVRNWSYDFRMKNVRNVALSFRLVRHFSESGIGEYVIDHLDFVYDDTGEKPRWYIRIAADPKYHDAIKKKAELCRMGEYYYEIVGTE